MHNYRPDQNAYVYWGGPSGFQPSARTELPAYLAAGVVVADLNGDSLPDVVLANHGDELGENRGFHLNLESYIYWGGVTGYSPSRLREAPAPPSAASGHQNVRITGLLVSLIFPGTKRFRIGLIRGRA